MKVFQITQNILWTLWIVCWSRYLSVRFILSLTSITTLKIRKDNLKQSNQLIYNTKENTWMIGIWNTSVHVQGTAHVCLHSVDHFLGFCVWSVFDIYLDYHQHLIQSDIVWRCHKCQVWWGPSIPCMYTQSRTHRCRFIYELK